MPEQIKVSVYRRLDNRLQGDTDDSSALAWELHRSRAQALEEAFAEAHVQVLDWGKDVGDTKRTHELVEILAVVGSAASAVPTTAILGWIGGVLATALSDTAVDSIKGLVARLRKKQEDNKIADFTISAHGRPLLTVYPDHLGGQVTVTRSDGLVLTTTWGASPDDLPQT